jgi:DNA modification methylase
MRIENRKIAELVPYERNARTHSEEQIRQIADSMKTFGWTNPVLVDGANGVIAGHGRLMAARLLGMTEVPCIELSHLSERERRAYILADNRLALNAGWDADLLALELADLAEFDPVGLLGFSTDELDAILNPGNGGQSEADEVPEPPIVPISEAGDSTATADVARLMAGKQADAAWTDPPYNVAYEGAAGKIENDDMDDGAFAAFLAAAFQSAFEALRPGAPIYVAHADTEGLVFRKSFVEAGFKLSSCLVWRKNALVLGRSDYQWQHEPVLYGWKPGAAHSWYGGRDKTTVFDINKPARNGEHPTMKPVELVVAMLENSTKPGDVVLDLFGGSGTTMIACEKLGRHARLVELDPKFVDVIVKRWQDFTGKEAILEETGCSFRDMALLRKREAA